MFPSFSIREHWVTSEIRSVSICMVGIKFTIKMHYIPFFRKPLFCRFNFFYVWLVWLKYYYTQTLTQQHLYTYKAVAVTYKNGEKMENCAI